MAQGMSLRQVARQLGVSRGVVERALAQTDSSFR
jgi:transposase